MMLLADSVLAGSCVINWTTCEYENSRIDLKVSPGRVLCRIHEDVVVEEEENEDDEDF